MQVLQWLSPAHLVVVKNVRSVVMEDSTERSAITPAGCEVGHLNSIAAKKSKQVTSQKYNYEKLV